MAWYKLDEEGNIEGLLRPLAPLINYVARLNGVDQYWQLSEPINIQDDDVVEFGFIGGVVTGTLRQFIGSASLSFGLSSGTTVQVFSEVNLSALLNGVEVISDNTQIPTSGQHLISASIVGNHTLEQISAAGNSRLMNLPVYNFKVIRNSTVTHEIPLTNKAQGAYQVATTTPLGANLYTQEVIENPVTVGNQWSYLGGGRWQLAGDGTVSALQFIFTAEQPEKGYLQFEIESISGGTLTCAATPNANSTFDTLGIKTFYYDALSDIGQIQFKRRVGSVQAIIKDIKHYDANGILLAEMVNYTPDVWEINTQ